MPRVREMIEVDKNGIPSNYWELHKDLSKVRKQLIAALERKIVAEPEGTSEG
jgi:hypothetical protein